MAETEFNLLDEPWIRVMTKDYEIKEVSLTEVLIHSHEYTDFAGELEAQNVAVLRSPPYPEYLLRLPHALPLPPALRSCLPLR